MNNLKESPGGAPEKDEIVVAEVDTTERDEMAQTTAEETTKTPDGKKTKEVLFDTGKFEATAVDVGEKGAVAAKVNSQTFREGRDENGEYLPGRDRSPEWWDAMTGAARGAVICRDWGLLAEEAYTWVDEFRPFLEEFGGLDEFNGDDDYTGEKWAAHEACLNKHEGLGVDLCGAGGPYNLLAGWLRACAIHPKLAEVNKKKTAITKPDELKLETGTIDGEAAKIFIFLAEGKNAEDRSAWKVIDSKDTFTVKV